MPAAGVIVTDLSQVAWARRSRVFRRAAEVCCVTQAKGGPIAVWSRRVRLSNMLGWVGERGESYPLINSAPP